MTVSASKAPTRRDNAAFFLFFAFLLGLASFFAIRHYVIDLENARVCTQKTEAVITNIETELRTRKKSNHRQTYWVYIATYEYTADGFTFTAKENVSKDTKTGTTAVRYYEPANPSNSIPSDKKKVNPVFLIVGIFFGLMGAGMLVTGVKYLVGKEKVKGV